MHVISELYKIGKHWERDLDGVLFQLKGILAINLAKLSILKSISVYLEDLLTFYADYIYHCTFKNKTIRLDIFLNQGVDCQFEHLYSIENENN